MMKRSPPRCAPWCRHRIAEGLPGREPISLRNAPRVEVSPLRPVCKCPGFSGTASSDWFPDLELAVGDQPVGGPEEIPGELVFVASPFQCGPRRDLTQDLLGPSSTRLREITGSRPLGGAQRGRPGLQAPAVERGRRFAQRYRLVHLGCRSLVREWAAGLESASCCRAGSKALRRYSTRRSSSRWSKIRPRAATGCPRGRRS
jgi:hypothetical protein